MAKKKMNASNKRILTNVLKRRGMKVTSIRVMQRATKRSAGQYMVTYKKKRKK